jgi:GNAT superfamily N-acetyltransferase
MGARRTARWKGTTVTLPGGDALRCEPATAGRFSDVPAVLGDRGGPGGCWCMFWRLSNADWRATDATQRREALTDRCAKSPPPGVLGYLEDRPVGWCAVAPRHEYPRMQSSPTFGPVDGTPSWAVSCLFIHRTARRRGVGAALVEAAVAMAAPTAPPPSTRSRSPRAVGEAPAISTRARPRCSSPSGSPRWPDASRSVRSSG